KKKKIPRGLANRTSKALFEKFQRTGNVSDDRAGNLDPPNAVIRKGNEALVQQSSNKDPKFQFALLLAKLDYDTFLPTVSHPITIKCFLTRFRFANL
ncbi:hypothetical protein TNIN_53791, partial [Trichonephila inaurata madagascariensis]